MANEFQDWDLVESRMGTLLLVELDHLAHTDPNNLDPNYVQAVAFHKQSLRVLLDSYATLMCAKEMIKMAMEAASKIVPA